MVNTLTINYFTCINFFIYFFVFFRLKGFISDDASHGAPTELTKAEEGVLIDYINLMSSIGYLLTKDQLLWEVKCILDLDGQKTKFTDNLPGRAWYRAFLKRHSDITRRVPEGISMGRAPITREMVEAWFDTANEYIKQQDHGEDALQDPRCVWNMDETAFLLDSSTGKVRPVLV